MTKYILDTSLDSARFLLANLTVKMYDSKQEAERNREPWQKVIKITLTIDD